MYGAYDEEDDFHVWDFGDESVDKEPTLTKACITKNRASGTMLATAPLATGGRDATRAPWTEQMKERMETVKTAQLSTSGTAKYNFTENAIDCEENWDDGWKPTKPSSGSPHHDSVCDPSASQKSRGMSSTTSASAVVFVPAGEEETEDHFTFTQDHLHCSRTLASNSSSSLGVEQHFTHKEHEVQSVPTDSEEVNLSWLDKAERLYAGDSRSMHQAVVVLRQCFGMVQNPFRTALFLAENALDYTSGKTTSFSYVVMKEFERWSKDNKDVLDHDKYISHEMKLHAFSMATGCNHQTLLEPTVKAFRLCHQDNSYFVPYIQPLIEARKYKEAVQCISKLGLQSHFDLKDICLPLILEDKINLVEGYVCKRRDQQEALLLVLNHLVDRQTDITSLIFDLGLQKTARKEKLTHKILSKLAIRLMKLYQIPQEVCPNICRERNVKALRYMLYKRYIEKNLGGEQFDELVRSIVDESEMLQGHLVNELVTYDVAEAAKWADFYSLKQEGLPYQVVGMLNSKWKDYVKPSECWQAEEEAPTRTDCSQHYQLRLSGEAIIWTNTKQGFYDCLQTLCKPGTTVGIDAEWRPSFGQTVAKMALLQLATDDQCFLLDIMTLTSILKEEDWTNLAVYLFVNSDILKLGYSIESDLQVLVKTFPSMREPLQGMQKVVDLQNLHYAICMACPDAFEKIASETTDQEESTRVNKTEERGLSDLVRQCLGRPLDKSQQMSDWQRRPLRQQQIVYAALDAYCLIEVYKVLTRIVQERQLQINVQPTANYHSKPRKSRMERKQQKVADRPRGPDHMAPNPAARTGPPMSPAELSVVCDTMLQGLGRHLRACGVDVHILDNTQGHDKAAKIAREQERVILTSGMPYNTLRSQVPEGMCLNVAQGKPREQVAQVLQHFNVAVNQSDIFSRCQVCNGAKYLIVRPQEMKQAWAIKKGTQAQGQGQSIQSKIVGHSRSGGSSDCSLAGQGQGESAIEEMDGFVIEYEYDHLDLETLCVGENNAPVHVETIPEPLFDKVELFYVCVTCGKVFWEGGHFTRVCEQFSHILSGEKNDESFYKSIKDKMKISDSQ